MSSSLLRIMIAFCEYRVSHRAGQRINGRHRRTSTKAHLGSKNKVHVSQIVLRQSGQKINYVPSDQEQMEQDVLTKTLI